MSAEKSHASHTSEDTEWSSPTRLPPGTLADFDWLRGLAAVAVLAGHVRGLFFVDFGDLVAPGPFARLAYMATGLGHQAVVVFFVLSGFFI